MILKRTLAVTFSLILSIFSANAEFVPPQMTNFIMDTAGIIDEDTERELHALIKSVEKQTGVQIAVLTLSSLGGESIEEVSIKTTEAWNLGQKGSDNGILITVAKGDRKIRIEVGYGLEEILTDTKCGLIIRNVIAPEFKNGDYSAGIEKGVKILASLAAGDEEVQKALDEAEIAESEEDSDLSDLIPLIFFGLFFIIIITDRAGFGPFGLYWLISLLTGRPFTRRWSNSHSTFTSFSPFDSDSDSGFGGFSGGSSGHDSGGGGSFGGGGASGSW